MSIPISSRSQELIKQYQIRLNSSAIKSPSVITSMDLPSLLSWLENKPVLVPALSIKLQQEIKFIHMSLRVELLRDLYFFMNNSSLDKVKKDTSRKNKMKFIFLAGMGILVAACEGFDNMVTIMSIFSLPSALILASGFLVSLFSIAAFCGFDLFRISNSLGVRLLDAHKLLNIYVQQWDTIKQIRKKIAKYNFSELSHNELQRLKLMIPMLQQCFKDLAEARGHFDKVLNSNSAKITKWILSGMAASIVFGGGFCAGQTVSLYIVGLFLATVTPASLPIILFSLFVGGAAFVFYLSMEGPGLKNVISSWFGLDEEKVASFCDKSLFAKEEARLLNLQEQVEGTLHLKEQLISTSKDAVSAQLVTPPDLPVASDSIENTLEPEILSHKEKAQDSSLVKIAESAAHRFLNSSVVPSDINSSSKRAISYSP